MLLPGTFGSYMLEDECHLGVFLLQRTRKDASERQRGDEQRTDDAFQWNTLL